MPITDYTTALVTGASSGIGAAIVERLCAEGLTVHALARRADALATLAARTGCIPHALDVTDGDGIARLAAEVEIDILVNNAGVDRPRSILQADAADVDLLVDVNLRAVLHMARLFVPGMAIRNRGHVVNIGSIAGEYHFGGNAIYHATKAAIHMLSRQLRVDLIGRMVRVTEICPGRVATDIFAHVHGDSAATRAKFIDGFLLPQASDIADAIVFAIAAPAAVNVGHIEIMPTLQVPGGLTTLRSSEAG